MVFPRGYFFAFPYFPIGLLTWDSFAFFFFFFFVELVI